jgi:1,4-alpha-glucan branching enzyme
MPGDPWQKFANLRLLLGYQFTQPGKKLLFMGGEIGQWNEWNHDTSLDWHLLQFPFHLGVRRWVEDLNRLYRSEPALYELDTEGAGFQWVDANDAETSSITFLRRARKATAVILVAANFTPVPRTNYFVGVPFAGTWKEILNSDAREYGGSGQGNFGGVHSVPVHVHGQKASLTLTLPPLGLVLFKYEEPPS